MFSIYCKAMLHNADLRIKICNSLIKDDTKKRDGVGTISEALQNMSSANVV